MMRKFNVLINKYKQTMITIVLTAIIIVLVLLLLGKNDNDQAIDKGKLIGNSISSISQLATTQYDYTYVDEFNEQSEINIFITELSIPLTNKYFVGAFEGTIKYGIDLNQIDESNIHINEETKTVSIDMPKVIKISHSTEKTTFYAMDNNLLNPFTPEDGENFKEAHMEDAERKALERGILGRIQDDTEKAIVAFITNLDGLKEYQVKCNFPKQDTIDKGELSFEK